MTELAAHGAVVLTYEIVISHEKNDSWTATIEKLGVCTSGVTEIEARSKAQVHALRAIADQIENDRSTPDKINFEVWLG